MFPLFRAPPQPAQWVQKSVGQTLVHEDQSSATVATGYSVDTVRTFLFDQQNEKEGSSTRENDMALADDPAEEVCSNTSIVFYCVGLLIKRLLIGLP